MIYVTGDTHGLEDFHKLHLFAGKHPELTINDYVIVAGDFGASQGIMSVILAFSLSACIPLSAFLSRKIQLIGGDHAGADYDYSQKTAIANKDLIFDSVKGADLIVVVAGMGGGMGSAVPSIIAEIAKENNIIAEISLSIALSIK